MALHKSAKPFMKGFWDGFFSPFTWGAPKSLNVKERLEKYTQPIKGYDMSADVEAFRNDFGVAFQKVKNDERISTGS